MPADLLRLTMSAAFLPPDHIAVLDAYRAQAALGRDEAACLAAAVASYRRHRPDITRKEALTAVRLILARARRRRSDRSIEMFEDYQPGR